MFKMPNLKGITKVITAFAKVHSPELLVGLGVAGMATSTLLAVRATPKAVAKIDNEIDEVNAELMDVAVRNHQTEYSPIDKLKPFEVVKLCYKDYLPAAITGVAGVICIIGGTNISLRRNAALVTAVKLSEVTIKDLQDYKNKVVETIGEDASTEIEAKADKERVEKSISNIDDLIVHGDGPVLYHDLIGGQWFRSDPETIKAAINRLNHEMNNDMYVSLNDLYSKLNLPDTVAGEHIGWDIWHGLVEPKFGSYLLRGNIPVATFSTRNEPRVDFKSLH